MLTVKDLRWVIGTMSDDAELIPVVEIDDETTQPDFYTIIAVKPNKDQKEGLMIYLALPTAQYARKS